MNPEKVLPPGVSGKVSGHLIIKVDEVFWTRNFPGEVFVELLWWGEKDSSVFRPEDITHKEDVKRKDSSVTYTIRTSPGLFESYLRNCGKLTFTILRGQNKNVVIGTSVVKDIEQICVEKNRHSYFPIFSPKGIRLGDLHICFELNFKLKQCHFPSKNQEKGDVVQAKDFRNKHNILIKPSSKSSTATSQEEQLLSDILQKGQELRKAMVMSVLADCPIDKLDSIINSNNERPSVDNITRKQEAKLVDFLLGKEMTPEEETKAIEMLRCTSPDENLLNIAKSSSSDPKVTKSTCCIHGKKCTKKKKNSIKSSSDPAVSVTSLVPPVSSSSDIPVDEGIPSDEKRGEIKEINQSFNCYELIIKTLNLTPEGCRKIYYVPFIKDSEEMKYNHNPPGTSFILEISVPSKGPWARKLKFTTKNFNFREKCVKFGQGTTHKLCGTVTWNRVKTQLLGSVFTVYWRHLNQRVPCPLGSAKLEVFSPSSDADSISLSLPVFSNTRLLTAHLNVSLKLEITSRRGGEAMFPLKESVETTSPDIPTPQISNSYETTDDFSPHHTDKDKTAKNTNASSEPSIVPLSSVSSDNENEAEPGPSSLDDELVRTINLLNSKADERPQFEREQIKTAVVPSRQEACVQTTLPIEAPDCPSCGCSNTTNKSSQRKVLTQVNDVNCTPQFLANERLNELKNKPLPCSFTRDTPSSNRAQNQINEGNRGEMFIPQKFQDNPIELNATKIHEYTIKIDKVVGVPLFTGDYDLDCYVDYSFPKVDSDGRLKLDHNRVGTEIKIALRETEFDTVLRHRLRLNTKLNRALLTVPSNEIVFYLWGRFYTPTPQDYRLGRAALPLVKLSAFELKYEQHQERQPVIEKCILPISVLNTSLTNGYKGPFGEMHITITYSNASGLSYREWRCKHKDDHYWCRSRLIWDQHGDVAPHNECYKAKCDVYDRYPEPKSEERVITKIPDLPSSYRPNYGSEKMNGQRGLCPERYGMSSSNFNLVNNIPSHMGDYRVESHNMNRIQPGVQGEAHINKNCFLSEIEMNQPTYKHNEGAPNTYVQTNLKEDVQNGFICGPPRGVENQDIPNEFKRNEIESKVLLDMNRRMQPIGESSKGVKHVKSPSINSNINSTDINDFNKAEQMVNKSKRENIVEKVLRDIKQRKVHETKIAAKNECSDNLKDFSKSVESKDAFDAFDLRVDLPTREVDTSDFEANSQYSFLKTPPPVESTFPNQVYSDFETGSSDSIKQRVQQAQSVNPFSSPSHMSLSLNSETSLFKAVPEKTIKPREMMKSSTKTSVRKTEEQYKQKTNLNAVKSSTNPKESRGKKLKHSLNQEKYLKTFEPEKENSSSDETLKSVESLKSYKEFDAQRQSRDVAVETEFLMQNKDTQTSLKEKDFFKARVEICRALGLPSLEVKQNNGKIELVKPTSHAYFSAIIRDKELILKTPVVEKKSNPVWDSSWEVSLPTELLKKCDRELEIFVELNGDCDEAPIRTSDGSMHCPIVLRTGVDLTPMTAGLEHASGWFSLSDRALLSRAQIKIIVTPLEDISRFREDWLKEYTKSKSKKIDLCVPERSSSLATSLQEKLFELERLTDRMKRKMASRSRWDDSPPLSLLAEVQNKNLGLSLEEVVNHPKRPGDGNKTTETATSPISGEMKNLSTIVISDDDGEDDGKGSCEIPETYTVSESSIDEDEQIVSNREDSLETPSQTINRILTRVRKTR